MRGPVPRTGRLNTRRWPRSPPLSNGHVLKEERICGRAVPHLAQYKFGWHRRMPPGALGGSLGRHLSSLLRFQLRVWLHRRGAANWPPVTLMRSATRCDGPAIANYSTYGPMKSVVTMLPSPANGEELTAAFADFPGRRHLCRENSGTPPICLYIMPVHRAAPRGARISVWTGSDKPTGCRVVWHLALSV